MKKYFSHGFTLIETLIVMAIILSFLGFVTVNILNIEPRSSIQLNTTTIVADIKNQQLKAMTGSTYNNLTSEFGIYFQTNQYTLFAGNNYQAGHAANVVIPLSDATTMSNSTFPDGPNTATVVFNKNTGEIYNFNQSANTITFRNSVSNETKTLVFNKLGVITAVQ